MCSVLIIAPVTFHSRCQRIVKADVSSEIRCVAGTHKNGVAKVYRIYALSHRTFATLETLIFLRLLTCRKTPNFRDNPFTLLVTDFCSTGWLALMQLGLPIFCDVPTSTSTICNVLTSGLNAIDIDYDNLVYVHRDSTRALTDYC